MMSKSRAFKFALTLAIATLSVQSHSSGMVPEATVLLINEADGGGSMKVKNTDDKAALLYTTIQNVDGDGAQKSDNASDVMLVATQPIVRLEGGQTQLVRFVLNNVEPLQVEQYKRVTFEGIPQAKVAGGKQIATTIRQNLPVIIHPKNLPVLTTPWEKLEWKVQGNKLTVTNPSAYVVRLSPKVVTQPSNIKGSIGKTFILPGETLNITLESTTTDKQVKISPVSRFGIGVGDYLAAVK
ncbi:fimbria/pilus chaperone family protein [Aeromonas jandaei]|uniref:fimbria/pilus chaperone family protein n=1 Tax=Aeromonas jandaei TaxID=650 RepID=UPI003BA0DDAC